MMDDGGEASLPCGIRNKRKENKQEKIDAWDKAVLFSSKREREDDMGREEEKKAAKLVVK